MVASEPSPGIVRYSAWAPNRPPVKPNTRSPTAKGVTSQPTATSSAANSTALDLHPWPPQPGEESRERLGPPEPAVGPVHRGRVHLDQHLVVVGGGLGHLGDPDHLRWAGAVVDGCLHVDANSRTHHPIPGSRPLAPAGRERAVLLTSGDGSPGPTGRGPPGAPR